SPQLVGQLQLSGVDIYVKLMPFDMQPSKLAMNFNGTRSSLQGTVNNRQVLIALSGIADWTQIDIWRAQFAAKGSGVGITV
ncbi:hypothetical protein Q6301_26850, partial [Klebsiella quasipneumoniae]|uniref:hypothetical protein n=1 Tax=Klebsiella quasipneumoniae TaxID=1463165 RepID=UPI00272F516E